jgi:hypothetical protein
MSSRSTVHPLSGTHGHIPTTRRQCFLLEGTSSEITGAHYGALLNWGLKLWANLCWSSQQTSDSSTQTPSWSRSCQWPRVTAPLHSLRSHQAGRLGYMLKLLSPNTTRSLQIQTVVVFSIALHSHKVFPAETMVKRSSKMSWHDNLKRSTRKLVIAQKLSKCRTHQMRFL